MARIISAIGSAVSCPSLKGLGPLWEYHTVAGMKPSSDCFSKYASSSAALLRNSGP